MLNYVGIKKNSGFICYVGLTSQADTKVLQGSATIAAGDFKCSIDGGAFANLTTLPTVTPAAGKSVKITLSAAEMNGDNIMVICSDAAGTEWCDEAINIQTTPVDASLVQINGTVLASATLPLKQLNIVNNSGDAIIAASTGGNGHGIAASANGSGSGIIGVAGATGNGFHALGGATSGHGFVAQAQLLGTGITAVGVGSVQPGINCNAGVNGNAIQGNGNGNGSGICGVGGITGHGINGQGGATSGAGILALAVGGGNGFDARGAANGAGIAAFGNGGGAGFNSAGGNTAAGITAVGGAASGPGIYAAASGSGVGINAIGVGSVSLLATQGISGPFNTATYNAMADAALVRNWQTTDTSSAPDNCTINALRANRRWAVSGSTFTAYAENGTTPVFTAPLTTDAAALQVVKFGVA